ncbi:MAG: IS5 family transposase ISBam3 [Burkholderia gladioli]|nr:MAG: IS5 family transposase ISBam3 [Burkholderia gladioli]
MDKCSHFCQNGRSRHIHAWSPASARGDTLIQALLGVKIVYRLMLRAMEGFAQSLPDLAFLSLPVPNYTTLCRWTKTLDVELPILRDSESIHLLVESTGLKVYGASTWKVRQYGYSKRRTWRKVRLSLNANTSQVYAALMTHQDVADGAALAKLLDQITRDKQIDIVGSAYETKPCHAAIAARSAIPSIPPREGPAHWLADIPGAAWRNGVVDAIARDGRPEWKKSSSCHCRSLGENAMYRFKTLTGNRFWARHIAS